MPRNVVLQLLVDLKGFTSGLNKAAQTAQSTFGRIGALAGGVGGGIGKAVGAVGRLAGSFNILGGNVLRNTVFFSGYYLALQAITGLLTGAVQQFLNLDEGLRKIQSITKDTDATMDGVRKQLIAWAREGKLAGKSAADIAQSMFDIVQSGFTAAQALEIARVAALAAGAGFTDASTAGKAIIAVLNAYQLPAEQAQHVSDILFQTVNVGVITFENLANELGTFIGAAALAHTSLEDLGAVMAVLTKRGLPAAEAATSVNQMLTAFIKPSVEMIRVTEELGYANSFAMLKTLGFAKALQAVFDAEKGDVMALGNAFKNIRAFRGEAILMTDQGKELALQVLAMQNASEGAGAMMEAWKIRSEALRIKLQILGAQILALIDPGTAAGNMIGRILDFISRLIATEHPIINFLRNLLGAFLVLAAAGAVLGMALDLLISPMWLIVVPLVLLATAMTKLDISWGDLTRTVERFFVMVLKHMGVWDNLRQALKFDIPAAIAALNSGDLDMAGLRIAQVIQRLTGLDITSRQVTEKLKELRVALLFLKWGFEQLSKGNVEGFVWDFRNALEAAFGLNAGKQIFDFFSGVVRFLKLFGTVLKEIFTSKIFREIVVDIATGLGVLFVALAKFFDFIGRHKAAMYIFVAALAAMLLLASPIDLLVIAILALIGAIGWLYRNWGDLEKKFPILKELTDDFREGLKLLWQGLKILANFVEEKVIPALKKFGDWVLHHKPALIALIAVLALVAVYFLALPIAILAVITAIGFLVRHWDEIKAKTIEVWNSIKAYLFGVWDSIVNFFQQKLGINLPAVLTAAWVWVKTTTMIYWNFIVNYFKIVFDLVLGIFALFNDLFHGRWGKLWGDVKRIVTDVWDLIKLYIKTVLSMIWADIQFALSLIWQIMNAVWNNIKREAQETWNTLRSIIGGATESIVSFFADLPGRILGFLGQIGSAAASIGGAIKDGIVSGIKGATGLVTDLLGAFKQLFADVLNFIIDAVDTAIPNKIVIPHFPDIDLPDTPIRSLVGFLTAGSFAKGVRNFAGGLAWVGEHGTELLRLPRGADVIPHGDVGQTLRSAERGNTTINAEVHLNTGLLSEWEELKKRAMDEMSKKLDDAAARANLSRPRYGTSGAGIPRP